MTRLGRRFPVHRGYNPPLLGNGIVTFDSVGAGNYIAANGSVISWTHTPVGKPNFVMVWNDLLYNGSGGVSCTINGIAMNIYFNYPYSAVASGYQGYIEGWILPENVPIPPPPWTFAYQGGGGAPYYNCNSIAYNNFGSFGSNIQTAAIGSLIAMPGSLIVAGAGGWGTGAASLAINSPGTTRYASTAGSGGYPLAIGDYPGSNAATSIAWGGPNNVNGAGLAALALLPRPIQPIQ